MDGKGVCRRCQHSIGLGRSGWGIPFPGWSSRCLHVDSQLETGRPELILKCQPHKLGLALVQRLGEASGSFRADAPATLLDIAEMGSRDPEKLRKGREAHFIGFSR